jgi:hypothetical protein
MRGRATVGLLAVPLGVALAWAGSPALAASGTTRTATAAAPPPPAVATYEGPSVGVYAATGLRRAKLRGLERLSLAPTLLVGSATSGPADDLVAVDPVTGVRKWTVHHARAGVVVGDGPRVVFGPDSGGVRDPQVNSVWIREATGKVRRVVQFANGKGLPGYDPGLDGENGLLGFSVDRAGKTVVVNEGNDVDLFVYDVFAVDVAKGKVTRVTSGRKSRHGVISANGAWVAYDREIGTCGQPYIRASNLTVAGGAGFAKKTVLSKGSCTSWLSQPAWVSARTLVAYRITRSGKTFRGDLVTVDVRTKKVTALTTVHDVAFAGAGLVNRVVAYQRDGATSTTVLTLAIDAKTGAVKIARTVSVKGQVPTVAGDNRF